MSFHHRIHRPRPVFALGAVIALIVFASIGCGSRTETTTENTDSSADPVAGAATESPAAEGAGASAGTSTSESATPAGEPGVVRLVDKGCVQFEPHWVTIAPGQTVTWVSELKAPVTVHVDAGAFNKTSFVVGPGARVTSGPAGTAKDYKVWTEPNACQGAPLGARGAGPGVAVQAAAGH